MKIHIKQIPPEGLHLTGEEEGDILGLEPEGITASSPVEYDLQIGLSGGGLFATGTLRVRVELECVSCLERFVCPVEVPDFAVQVPLEGPETVDLTPMIREDIVLNLPAHPHCDWNGEHACKGVAGVEAPSPPEEADAWGDLDKLDLK